MNSHFGGFTDVVLWTIRKFSPHPLLSTPEARAKMAASPSRREEDTRGEDTRGEHLGRDQVSRVQ